MFQTEKAQIISAVLAFAVFTILVWGGIIYTVLFCGVLANAIGCLIVAASAYWGENHNGEAKSVDVFTARLFFVSTIVHAVINCM